MSVSLPMHVVDSISRGDLLFVFLTNLSSFTRRRRISRSSAIYGSYFLAWLICRCVLVFVEGRLDLGVELLRSKSAVLLLVLFLDIGVDRGAREGLPLLENEGRVEVDRDTEVDLELLLIIVAGEVSTSESLKTLVLADLLSSTDVAYPDTGVVDTGDGVVFTPLSVTSSCISS